MKIAGPDAFSGGKREDVDEFVGKCNRVFRSREAVFHSDELRVIYAINLLKKKAYRWIAPHENKAPEDRPALFQTWASFSSHLRTQFTDIDKALVARTELRELKQLKSVSSYSRQFHELAAYVTLPDEALRFQFFIGLKIDIKLHMLSHERYATLQELAEQAAECDRLLLQVRKADKSNVPVFNYQSRQHSRSTATPAVPVTTSHVPMEVTPSRPVLPPAPT